MAEGLQQTLSKLAEETRKNQEETRGLRKENITLRSSVKGLTKSNELASAREEKVQRLEELIQSNETLGNVIAKDFKKGIADFASSIPGASLFKPLMRTIAQKTPLKGIFERRAEKQREKLQNTKAEMAVNQSGIEFGSEEERAAAIERVKVEMERQEQEKRLQEKQEQIANLLGVQYDKFESIMTGEKSSDETVGSDSITTESPSGSMSAVAVERNREGDRDEERRHQELIDAINGVREELKPKKESRYKKIGGGDDGEEDDDGGLFGGFFGGGGKKGKNKKMSGSSKGGKFFKTGGKGMGTGRGGFVSNIASNAASIMKGAAAIAALGAALIPFAYAAKMMNEVDWESLGKAGVAIVGLGGAAMLLGKAGGSMMMGAAAVAVLGGALWIASNPLETFSNLSWEGIAKGFVALAGVGVIAAVMGTAAPLIMLGSLAIGALGVALLPFAYAAEMAAPAITEIADAFMTFKDVPIKTLIGIPVALAAIGAALVAMSGGNFVSGILDGIGKLFGNDSPIDKMVKLGKSAKDINQLGQTMEGFGGQLQKMMDGIDNVDFSSFDKLDGLAKQANEFVDEMPGVIGLAKLNAFAFAMEKLGVGGGTTEAVASGVESSTGKSLPKEDAKTKINRTKLALLKKRKAELEETIEGGTGITNWSMDDEKEELAQLESKISSLEKKVAPTSTASASAPKSEGNMPSDDPLFKEAKEVAKLPKSNVDTSKLPAGYSFSEMQFAEKDYEGYKKYQDWKNSRTKELTKYYQDNGKSPKFARSKANMVAKREAHAKFWNEYNAAIGGKKVTPTATTAPKSVDGASGLEKFKQLDAGELYSQVKSSNKDYDSKNQMLDESHLENAVRSAGYGDELDKLSASDREETLGFLTQKAQIGERMPSRGVGIRTSGKSESYNRGDNIATAQGENAALTSETSAAPVVYAPQTTNVSQVAKGGGGGNAVVPLTISDSDQRVRIMTAHAF